MTAAAFPAGIVPPRPAWRSLLWTVPVTGAWILLIYWRPIIPTSGVPTTAHQLTAHGLIALGLWLGLESTDLTPSQRRTTWLAIMIPYTLWFAVAWSAAINGVFHADASPLPLLLLAVFLPVITGAPLLLLSKRVGQVLDAMPATWLVALQLYRVFGSWALVAGLRGVLPDVFALPAGTADVLTGLFAVPAAIAVAAGTAQGRRAAIIWNIFGLVDFAVAMTLGIITTPGPFQLIVPNVLNSVGAGAYPGVLTPAFVVPSSILLHALSLRQLSRRPMARGGSALDAPNPRRLEAKMSPASILSAGPAASGERDDASDTAAKGDLIGSRFHTRSSTRGLIRTRLAFDESHLPADVSSSTPTA